MRQPPPPLAMKTISSALQNADLFAKGHWDQMGHSQAERFLWDVPKNSKEANDPNAWTNTPKPKFVGETDKQPKATW